MFNYERGSSELGRWKRIYFYFIPIYLPDLPNPCSKNSKLKIC